MRADCTKSQQGAEVVMDLHLRGCVFAETFLQAVRVRLPCKLKKHPLNTHLANVFIA
jgi:hypothetical protein